MLSLIELWIKSRTQSSIELGKLLFTDIVGIVQSDPVEIRYEKEILTEYRGKVVQRASV